MDMEPNGKRRRSRTHANKATTHSEETTADGCSSGGCLLEPSSRCLLASSESSSIPTVEEKKEPWKVTVWEEVHLLLHHLDR